MGEEVLNNYENFQAYWDLVNLIDSLCDEAIETGMLYGDDIISALDRVKTQKIVEHMKYRFNLREDKNNLDDVEESDKDEFK